ncbi:MAG: restriction endonuclease subunit S [Burkholderiales bacterium]
MAEQTASKVPQIRFKGFDGEWGQKKLGEVADVYDGTHQTPNYTKQGVMFLSVENIRSLKSNKFISEKAFKEDFKVSPQRGDVLMTRIGDIGTANVFESDERVAYYVSLALLKLKDLDPYFLKQCISSNSVVEDLWRRTLHIAFPKKINKNEIERVVISPPILKFEQTKIGEYFRELDSLIGLHQRKHDKLVTLKKAMLQKMFPQPGATTPEIRFKGFSGDWVEKTILEDDFKVIDFRGRTPKKLGLDWSQSGFLALSALNVKNGYIDFTVDAHFGNATLYDAWMKGCDLHKNQVLFTTEAPMGNVAQVPDDRKYILSQRTIAFEVNPKLLSEDFFAVLLRAPFMHLKLSALSSGGTAKGISQKSLTTLTSFFPPDFLEQQKIGTYFRTLDELITQHATQLQKLQQIKSACLERMFV